MAERKPQARVTEIRKEIEGEANEVWVSARSCWEISIKFRLGMLPLPDEPHRNLPKLRQAAGLGLLAIGESEVCQIHRLPARHGDPFDRLLTVPANGQGMVIATHDPAIRQYPVRSLW